jgi:LPXTG-motif cell wall-anchored protein
MNKSILRGIAATSSILLGAAFAVSAVSSAQAVAPETFKIESLALTNVAVVDVDDTAGDDGGFIATMQNAVLLANDTSGYTFDLDTLAPIAATDVASEDNEASQASDLKSNIAYELSYTAGSLDQMTEIDQDGNLTSNVISVSPPVDLTITSNWLLMSGYGYIAMWDYDAGRLHTIAPDGTSTEVTNSGHNAGDFVVGPATGNREGSDYFDAAGVVEFDGTDYWFVGTDDNASISRFNITAFQTVEEELLANVDGVGDSDTFSVSACKWYSHSEADGDSSWFGQNVSGMDEALIVGDAVLSTQSDSCATAPELPNTGVDAGTGVALGAAIAAIGALSLVAGRRREAASR